MDRLLSINDIKEDVRYILDLAGKIKAGKIEDRPLEGKTLAMIFYIPLVVKRLLKHIQQSQSNKGNLVLSE